MADASIRLAVEGGGDFKAAMKAAESSVKLFNTEIKNLATGLTNTSAVQTQTQQKITLLAGASEAAKGKVSLLTSEYNKQRDKLNELAKALETASRENGENSAEAIKAEKALNNQTKVVNDLGIKLSNAQKEADNFEKELKDLESQGSNAGNSMKMFGTLITGAGNEMKDAEQKALSFKDVLGANIFGGFITQGVQVAVRELQQFVREIIEVGSTYEAQMAKVSAISGAFRDETGQTMKSLEGLTRELSGYFSALEIGQAMEYQAMAGWDVPTIKATTEAILNLAQAGGVDLARASELMTTGLNAFRMTSEDAGEMMQNATRYADVLAVTASSAATDVDSMGEVFAKVAPLAGAMGYTIEDMSLAIGLMANNGLTGAEAGTALRTTLSSLVTPSEKVQKIFDELGITLQNDMGEYYTFEEVLGQLRDGFSGLEKAQKLEYAQEIAGARAKTAFISVIDAQQDSYDALKLAINNSAGAAEEMAQVMGDTYEGDARRAKAATENLQSAIFELFQGPLRRGKQIATDFANGLAEMLRSSDKLIPVLKGVATGVATFAAAMAAAKIANFIASMGGLLGIIPKIQAAFISLNASLGAFGLVALAISAVVSALVIYNETADRTVGIADTLNEKLSENAQRRIDDAEKTREAYDALREAQEARVAADMAELEDVERLAKELEGLVDANGKVQEGEEERAEFIVGKLNQALGLELELVDGLIQGQEDLSVAISDAIAKKEAQLLLEAEQDVYLQALQDKARLERDVAKAYQENEIAIKNLGVAEENLQNVMDATYHLEEDRTAAIADASRELENAKRVAEETGQAYESLKTEWGVAVNEIINFREAEAAAHEGNYQRVREILLRGQEAITSYADVANKSTEEQTRILGEQMDTQFQIYQETYKSIEDKNSEFGQAMIQEAYNLYLESVDEYNKIGADTVTAFAGAVDENTPIAVEAVEGMIDESTALADEARKEAGPIGEALTEGTAEGIDRRKQEVIRRARQLMKEAISAMRAEADINSPARKFRDEVGQYIPLGVAEGIKATADVVREASQGLMGDVVDETAKAVPKVESVAERIGDALKDEIQKTSGEIAELQAEIAEESAQKELEQYQKTLSEKYAELEKAEVKNRQKIQEEITKLESNWAQKQLDADRKAEQQRLNERLKTLQNYQKEYEKSLADIEKQEESFAKKLSDYGELFTKIKDETGEFLKIDDINEDIRAIERYGEALNAIQFRGISDSLLSEITSLNIDDATAYIGELMKMSDSQYERYMAAWEEKQNLAKQIASEFYADELAQLSEEMLGTMQEYVDEFGATGLYLMDGVAQGVLDGRSGVVNAVKDSLMEAVAAANSVMEIHSPSRVMEKIGRFMAQGLDVGFVEGMRNTNQDIVAGMLSARDSVTQTGIMQATEAAVNGINMGRMMSGNSQQPVYITLTLDGRQIANAVLDPLRDVSRQRGVRL